MLDFLRREGDSSNTVIGIILLIVLLVFVGPDVLPQLLSSTLPFVDEGIPCTRTRTAEDRANHQSLIGRAAVNPLLLAVEPEPLPVNSDDEEWIVRVTVINNTIGTVPFVFNENQVIIWNNEGVPTGSGVGLRFTPPLSINLGTTTPVALGTYPEENIRLLGPRQRCVYRVRIPTTQIGSIQGNVTTVRAYYRITNDGATNVPGGVYPDQGLDIIEGGYTESEPVIIPSFASANDAS